MNSAPYRETMTRCSYCGGSGRMASRYSDAGLDCPECGGEGEWPAECAECHEAKPLNDDGLCRDCWHASLTPDEIAELRRAA